MSDMERRETHINLVDKITNIEIHIAKGFAELTEQNKYKAETLDRLMQDQDRILHILYGNGKEGIITTLSKLKEKISMMWTGMVFISVAVIAVGAKSLPEIFSAISKVL